MIIKAEFVVFIVININYKTTMVTTRGTIEITNMLHNRIFHSIMVKL